jgi:hypothetical protein
MTTRTFWAILIKVAAIWLFIQSFWIMQELIYVVNLFNDSNDNSNTKGQATLYTIIGENTKGQAILYGIVGVLLPALILILILWLCFFKTDWLIDKLKLEKGIAEKEIQLNFHRSTILTVVVITIGGLTFIDSLPILCKQVFDYYKQTKLLDAAFYQHPNTAYIILYSVKTFIGYFLMTNSRMIVNVIELRRKKSMKEIES